MVGCGVPDKRIRLPALDPIDFVLDGSRTLMLMPDRRSAAAERREQTRTGRRDGDPRPRCSGCGLTVDHGAGHSSDRECIDALREEIELSLIHI